MWITVSASGRRLRNPGRDLERIVPMKTLIFLVGWFVLLALCWPLALVALVLAPVIWLLSIPFRLVGLCVAAVFALLRALLFFPARLLGYRPN